MIFVASFSNAQNMSSPKGHLLLLQKPQYPLSVSFSGKLAVTAASPAQPFLSPAYYASHLGIFCQQEIKFEKTAKIPFKFRLGSVEDCDRMEGKHKGP